MIPAPFTYHRPRDVAEALSLLVEIPGSVLLAGGQSLINAMKLDLVAPTALIDIHRLDDLRSITATSSRVVIGAAATYAEIAESEIVRTRLPIVASICAGLVDRQVRNRGTLGGNVCLNDPASNLPPLLATLGASFDTLTVDGVATCPADEFFQGTMLTAAARGVMTAVSVPVTTPTTRVFYRHQQVGADSWAIARAVGAVSLTSNGLADVRLFLAAVPGSPVRLSPVEAVLTGSTATDPTVVQAALAAFDSADIRFIGDAHGTASFRRQIARVQLKRVLADITKEEEAA